MLIYALWSGSFNAKLVGLIWLGIGVLIAVYFRATGRSLAQSDIDGASDTHGGRRVARHPSRHRREGALT